MELKLEPMTKPANNMYQTNDSRTTVEYRISDNEAISTAVIQAVSQFKGCKPLELPPLDETIDTDGLERLCKTDSESVPYIAFTYNGCQVTIYADKISITKGPSQ